MKNEINNLISSWYEVRADDEKVAAFSPISREASDKAFKLVDDTHLDLYKDKVIQIVACRITQIDANHVEHRDEVIWETHPTVIEEEYDPIRNKNHGDFNYETSIF